MTTHDQITRLTVEPLGGPTAILEYAGLRWLADPAFSPPGEYAGGLVKTAASAVPADAIGSIDVVLLSHDHHSDNLDPGGRACLPRAGQVLTTVAGAVQRPAELDCSYLTLSSDHATDAAKLLGVHTVVPLHYEGWTHFTHGAHELRAAFAGNGISDRLALAEPGIRITV